MIQISLLIAALVTPFLSYGWGRLQGKYEISAAVQAERSAQITECNGRVIRIQVAHDEAARDAAIKASEAAATVGETPTIPAELKKLCDASPSCRSRGAK